MPAINLLLLSSKSTLHFLACDTEAEPVDICLLPTVPQISFLSSQWKVGHCTREGASLPNSSFLFSLLALCCLCSLEDMPWGSFPGSCSSLPTDSFPASTTGATTGFAVGSAARWLPNKFCQHPEASLPASCRGFLLASLSKLLLHPVGYRNALSTEI